MAYKKKSARVSVSSAGKQARAKRKRKKRILETIIIIAVLAASLIAELNYHIIQDFIAGTIDGRSAKTTYFDYKNKASYDAQGRFIMPKAQTNGDLLIHFLYVGQGDSTIVQFPDGKNMIIDGGPRSAAKTVTDIIEANGINKFDYVLLTHPDEDHVGSLDDAMLKTEVKNIFMPDVNTTTGVYTAFLSAVEVKEDEGANVLISRAGMTIEGDGYRILFFTPTDQMYENVSDINAISPIIFLEYAGKKAVFTGDATKKTESEFLKVLNGSVASEHYSLDELRGYDADADIYKAGHHGSNTSSSQEFLQVIRPEISIVSSGADNRYGHPHKDVTDRLEMYGTMFNTAVYGHITVIISPDGQTSLITVITESDGEQQIAAVRFLRSGLFVAMRKSGYYGVYICSSIV